METPPPPAKAPRQLGPGFVFLLLLPIAVFAFSFSAGAVFAKLEGTSGAFVTAALVLAPICAGTCTIMVARSGTPPGSRTDLAILTCCGALLLYGATFFAGCMYGLSHMGL